ncbi:MAG: Holliday junction branch migration protein RuvA [Fimbriimonadaceae bacterium]
MISQLRGEVWEAGANRIVLGCGGVGYEVHVPPSLAIQVRPGALLDLSIRMIVREDDWSLFGFESAQERHAFDLLREIKGCGPKTSLALIGHLGSQGVSRAIALQDTRSLAGAQGVGPKLAERICAELKDKTGEIGVPGVGQSGIEGSEVVSALVALGYRRQEAEMAERASGEGTVEERVKAALRSLKK